MPEPSEKHVDRIMDKAVSLISKNVAFEDFPDNIKIYYKRWQVAHDMLYDFSHRGSRFILNLYLTRFPEINNTQARLDLRAAQIVFGRMSKDSREFKRQLAIDRLETSAAKAAIEGDLKGQAAIEAVLERYLDPAKDPIDAPDWEAMIKNVNVTIVFDPRIVGVEPMPEDKVKQLWASVQKKRDFNIQDVDFSEVDPPKSTKQIEEENE